MVNRIRTGDPCGFNKGHSSKFCVGSTVRQTPEEGQRTYRLKCGNNNEDEDNSPKTLNDKNHQVLSQKFRQLVVQDVPEKTILFSNQITLPILIEIISNFNSICRKNAKFCVEFFFSVLEFPLT